MGNEFWHSRYIEDIMSQLNTTEKGLSIKEADYRLHQYGINRLPRVKKEGLLKIFINQFVNPIIYILLVAVILSFVIGEIVDGVFIILVIALDALLGTFQEWKAENTSDSLQELIRVNVNVLRDGKFKNIDSEKVVIGDVVNLEPGDKISADIRLFDAHNLTIDESVLTGESNASDKNSNIMGEATVLADRENMAYAGTVVVTGRGMGVVVSTAGNTEIGKIADKVLFSERTKSPLVIRMEKFTKQISYFMIIIILMLTILLYFKGYAPRELFFAVVALSVSMIPEGLPLALTLSLSIAASRMAKKNVIVKKLNSVESLGSCTVIASDKTGTLTLNQQTVKKISTPDGRSFQVEGIGYNGNGKVISEDGNNDFIDITDLALLGKLNNEASLIKTGDKWESFGDSVDIALLALAYKLNVNINNNIKIVGSIPYESQNKYSALFYKEEQTTYCTVKGSLEKLMDFCDTMKVGNEINRINRNLLIEQNKELAEKGYRVIAIAKGVKKDSRHKEEYNIQDIPKLTLLGLIGLVDPIREEVVNSIKKCKAAGIKVVMITGDHPLTAFAIAKELKMLKAYDCVTSGEEIERYLNMGKNKFDRFIKNKTVFSRVTPLQKLEIIQSFKRQGEFVAVTGDGVNDAPAMKVANISVAMGSGTDIAKETGTMIVTDDNFMSIVSGIEEGRNAYNNIRKVIYFLISAGFAEVLFFALSVLLNLPLPLLAVQLLWLNLVTDGIQDIALSFEKGDPNVMKQKPRKPGEKIFNKLLLQETLISGLYIGIIVFLFWIYLIKVINIDVSVARGYVLILMVFMQNVHVFNCRSESLSVLKLPLRNNPLIVVGVVMTLLLQIFVTENQFLSGVLKTSVIPIYEVFLIFILALPILLVMDIFKKTKSCHIVSDNLK